VADRDPWIKFYPDIWNGDLELASCRLSTQGFLSRLLLILHSAEPYGYLLSDGHMPTTLQLSKALGVSQKTCKSCLEELEKKRVLKRDEFGLYNKRMRSEWEKRQLAKAHGKKGGNPELVKGRVNPPVKPPVKPRVKPEENKNKSKKKKENNTAPPGAEYTPEFSTFWEQYPRMREKKKAFKNWNTRLKEGVDAQVLIRAAGNYAAECDQDNVETKYIKLPATFLGPSRPYEDYTNGIPATRENEKEAIHDAIMAERRKRGI